MKFVVIAALPELVTSHFAAGVVGQALQKGLISIATISPRDFVTDVHRTIDDRPFGGGDGMILLADPLQSAIAAAKAQAPEAQVWYLSAQGTPWTDAEARVTSQAGSVILLAGRYGGVDQRLLNASVDREISIGDYVLSGGELAVAVVIDSVARHVPGVLGHAQSAQSDSFAEGLLEEPQFTRPRTWEGHDVPEILFSGNHAQIKEYRHLLRLLVTAQKRPDLLVAKKPSKLVLQKARALLEQMSLNDCNSMGFEDKAELLRRLQ